MRFTLLLLIAAFCFGLSSALPLDDNVQENPQDNVQDSALAPLLSLADQGEAHANEGAREERAFCCGGGYGGYGRRRGYGYGGGFGFGYGYGGGFGYRRGGFGYGRRGWGRRGWGYGR